MADATDDDRQLALYCCYELHYGGFVGVDDGWEWEPSLLGVRAVLERWFEDGLREQVGPVHSHPEVAVDQLWELARAPGAPSLSGWMTASGELEHVRELAIHRSAYQLKEADPHSWGIPRVSGEAKAALVAIQADEYGNGDPAGMHAALFGDTMEGLGLDRHPNAYLAAIPGVTLATTNLISMLGLHRRLRGASARPPGPVRDDVDRPDGALRRGPPTSRSAVGGPTLLPGARRSGRRASASGRRSDGGWPPARRAWPGLGRRLRRSRPERGGGRLQPAPPLALGGRADFVAGRPAVVRGP